MQYAWLNWSLLLLAIWLVIYLVQTNKHSRHEMLTVSMWTSLMGLTEPLFVPEYWSPPSLFNLALRTGFDIESIIFSFAIGGLAVVLYEWIFRVKHTRISKSDRKHSRHRFHLPILLSAPIIFFVLYGVSDYNPLHLAIVAMTAGGLLTWYCRPDLKKKMLVSAVLFTFLYFFYFLTLIYAYPGFVEKVWNLSAISGILLLGVPMEELLFAASFGFLWSSVYEHIMWRRVRLK